MKKDYLMMLSVILIVIIITNMLYVEGKFNYQLAEEQISKTDGTDIDITSTLYFYGFDLDWFEQPTTVDYILSPFKSQNR